MNPKFKNFIKGFSFVMTSQIYSMFISALIVFIMPKYFSNESYAYYQLENLYCGYIWIVSLGIHTGFYLKYGGNNRNELRKNGISSQFVLYIIYIVAVSVILLYIIFLTEHDINKKFVLSISVIIVAMEIIIETLGGLMQAVNSMRQYSVVTLFLRTLSVCLLIAGILFKIKDFRFLIIQDLVSKVITMGVCLFFLRDVLFVRVHHFLYALKELKSMFAMGISILLSTYASRLINSMTQYAIENIWGLIVFGKISLCFSISSLLTKLVSVAGTVLVPTLRRIDRKRQIQIYNALNILIPVIILSAFCLYYPMIYILKSILPSYAESLNFLAVLLPMCLYETKVALLLNTYLQIIHKEREILYTNLISVIFSLIFSIMVTIIFNNLFIAVISIDIVMAFRCWREEKRLYLYMEEIEKGNLDLWSMSGLFIFCNWSVEGWIGTMIYSFAIIIYIGLKWKKILNAVKYICIIATKK